MRYLVNIILVTSIMLSSSDVATQPDAHSYSVEVSIKNQQMVVYKNKKNIADYPISTSATGIGNEKNSNKTPLGKHRIIKKIGKGSAIGTIFKSGVTTHKTAIIHKKPVPPAEQQDLITTRVMQLEGLETRNNNSYSRGIWIHGTPYEGNIGTPASHGCVRMRNKDMIELFDLLPIKTIVTITK